MAGAGAKAGSRGGGEARTSFAAFVLGGSVAAVPLLLSAPPPTLLAGPGIQGRAALALHVAGVNAALLLGWGRAPGGLYQVSRGRGHLDPAPLSSCGLAPNRIQEGWACLRERGRVCLILHADLSA